MRRSAADRVSGSVKLSFAWDVTARSLLNLKLAALERVLAQRTEVLCMLNPTTADTALRWAREDAQQGLLHPPEAKDKVSCMRLHLASCIRTAWDNPSFLGNMSHKPQQTCRNV